MQKPANIVRVIFGLVMVAGAVANTFMTLTQPEIYASFADMSLIPLYRNLWYSLVVPYLEFWLALVIVFELTVGILILSKGPAVKVGLVGAILFFLFLVPFWWQGGSLLNIVFAVILALLLRYDHDASLIDMIRRTGSQE